MIFVDIDGVCIDFYSRALELGHKLEINCHGAWDWGFHTPEEFYSGAKLQPWFGKLMAAVAVNGQRPVFLTKDFSNEKRRALSVLSGWEHVAHSPFIEARDIRNRYDNATGGSDMRLLRHGLLRQKKRKRT